MSKLAVKPVVKSHHAALRSRRDSFWTRWRWGYECVVPNTRYAATLPAELFEFAMTVRTGDREHAKQGRATLRVRLDDATVYLKRHYRLGIGAAVSAALNPAGAYSPAKVEAQALARAAALEISVPEVVAWGERLERGGLQSFLMVKELEGRDELNLVVTRLSRELSATAFARWKRKIVRELARVVARLHVNNLFHKDMYLCHAFVAADGVIGERHAVTLIDLHRLARHGCTRAYWVVKDLAQLLFSTFGVEGIDERDLLRFWCAYRRFAGAGRGALLEHFVKAKAARYARHEANRRRRSR
jgi:heptose I phosphotransferase